MHQTHAPRSTANRYAIVLAGGDGLRLEGLIRERYGTNRPKQFCNFGGTRPLIAQAVARSIRFTGSAGRVAVSLNRAHRTLAEASLAAWPNLMRVEQPANLGTTPGLLLPLIRILAIDPTAIVWVVPADHVVSNEPGFVQPFSRAADALGTPGAPQLVLLGGARLPTPEADLGWIVPGPASGPWRSVHRFTEKPDPIQTVALHRSGAFANTFAMVARGETFGQLARRTVPGWWRTLSCTFFDRVLLDAVYRDRAPSDFSADVLAGGIDMLGVLELTGARWRDVGTPERVRGLEAFRKGLVLPPQVQE